MSESNLPKMSIEERMKMATENPEKYTSDELAQLWFEWNEHLAKIKADEKEAKTKEKMLQFFESALNNEYTSNWKIKLKISKDNIKKKYKNWNDARRERRDKRED